jgi:diguanylate cyclase (GGDEF)-like protein
MFTGWVASRSDTYLLSWASGLTLVVAGVVCFALNGERYTDAMQFAAFALSIAGLSFIHAGALQFSGHRGRSPQAAAIGAGLVGLTAVPFLAHLSGVGTIIGNVVMAILLVLAGVPYWLGRQEARLPMTVNAVLYAVSGLSFVFCSLVLLIEQRWVLTALAHNWAEDLNAVVVIVGLTGIGAISLTLNQLRSAHHHRREAMTDALTGLLNRRALFDTLDAAPLESGSAVIMFDIDHFKAINDRLGHAGGDRVLDRFGRLLRDELRHDDLSARLGGEEFCAVLPNLTKRSAAAVAERVRAAFEASGTLLDQATVSAGVAISGLGGEPFGDVLRRADEALYAAKAGGRNRIHAPGPRLVA